MSLSVPLLFSALEAVPRRGEPVTVGLPFPCGMNNDDALFRLIGPDGTQQTLQTKVLDHWSDGSIRWCLFDFLADWDGQSADSGYRITLGKEKNNSYSSSHTIANNTALHELRYKAFGFEAKFSLEVDLIRTERGPIRNREFFESQTIAGLSYSGWRDIYHNNQCIQYSLTIANTHAAEHPGGNWDLGTQGSVLFHQLEIGFRFEKPDRNNVRVKFSICRNARLESSTAFMACQRGSGGENWRSVNHIDAKRTTPIVRNGCIVQGDENERIEKRATPIVSIICNDRLLSVAMPCFWEIFPIATAADSYGIDLKLFPAIDGVVHEIQGGEQKTYEFTVAYGKDTITDDPLVWARSPITVTAPPEWYATSRAIPYMTPKATDPNVTYLGLVYQAIDGPDTFLHKREKIDEYGWRHFGDIWGDHEAVYHNGPEPMISHYNNQYDCVNGFLIQYLRSGDTRWLQQGLECADHTCDIDIYHYAPADTGTHRSYPKSLRNASHFESGQDLNALGGTGKALKKNYAVGGGPSAAHNYNTGLMNAYFLTGNPIYRENAIGLADYVLNIDDGTKTIFRWLCRGDTGLAIESSAGYLGPGRASGNSLNALLVGHQLTGDAKYLAKAEQIIRRVVHPKQNLDSLDLLNAELRWFYTMYLQSLGRYLDYKIEWNQNDEAYAYARMCLLHYAKWMAAHEHPILDKPEKLQYPTETWAAQDMRKVEVFQYAAKHSTGEDREKYLERAEWFFRYVERTLDTFPPTEKGIATKSLCRPVILLMNFGWSRAWWMANRDVKAPEPLVTLSKDQLGEWTMFTPQKQIAIRRAKRLIVLGAVTVLTLVIGLVAWLVL